MSSEHSTYDDYNGRTYHGTYSIKCNSIKCGISTPYMKMDDLVKAWNRRKQLDDAPVTSVDELYDRIEAIKPHRDFDYMISKRGNTITVEID